MKKFWLVYTEKNSGVLRRYDTKDEAIDEARRMQVADQSNQFIILEAILSTVRPVPMIEVKELA